MEGPRVKLEQHQIDFLNKMKAKGHTYASITVKGQQVCVSFYPIAISN